MNAAVSRRHTGPFLPEITSKKRRIGAQHRTKQESLPTGSVLNKPTQILSREDIALVRNSLKQNICVKLLQEGFPRSFSELFYLLRVNQDQRMAAEPGSEVLSQIPLEDQQDKLETLKLHLSLAEKAERTGSWSTVNEQRLFLGRYFSAPEDFWLSLHFLLSCINKERGSRSRPATEARACLAEVYLQQGELEEARKQAEICLKMSEDGGWLDLSGRPLKLRARHVLWRIFNRLADAPLADGDYDKALKLLHQGYSMATQSEDKQIVGEGAYRLGLTYQSTGDHNTAKQFFNTCMQICGTLEDPKGLGKAYKAMAKSTESEGNIDETILCLEKLADVTRSNGLQRDLTDACLYLGDIYYSSSQFENACQYYLQGYEVACDLGDVALLQKAQVLAAGARAQALIGEYSADVESATPAALRRLLAWKETRGSRDPADNTAAAAAAALM